MRILLTGAFGNVGSNTLATLLERGHQVRCFDVPTKANKRVARRFKQRVEIAWGDLRDPEQVAAAVVDQDVAIHLAFVIPMGPTTQMVVATLTIVVLTIINIVRVKAAEVFASTFTGLKLLGIVGLVLVGLLWGEAETMASSQRIAAPVGNLAV